MNGLKFLIVGSGLYGAVMAERIASVLREPVLILEKRDHVGGNCYSSLDSSTGIEVHKYGTHIFHTSNTEVMKYLSQFMTLNSYVHKVETLVGTKKFPMPINLKTINDFYQKNFSSREAELFLKQEAEAFQNPKDSNLESFALSKIGRPLYETFIRGYTLKQWGQDPSKLPSSIVSRLPVRYDENDRYFSDVYEGIPTEGYSKLFESLLRNPLISVKLGADFFELRHKIPKDCQIIYTGPIDRYFDYRYGQLSWRVSDFKFEIQDVDYFQERAVINYADSEVAFTRIHEFKHLHPERRHTMNKTIVAKEYSRESKEGEIPFYPINAHADRETFKKYKAASASEKNVIFGGRLGTYTYIDMHQAVAMALNTFKLRFG